jgi:hypothetical protein
MCALILGCGVPSDIGVFSLCFVVREMRAVRSCYVLVVRGVRAVCYRCVLVVRGVAVCVGVACARDKASARVGAVGCGPACVCVRRSAEMQKSALRVAGWYGDGVGKWDRGGQWVSPARSEGRASLVVVQWAWGKRVPLFLPGEDGLGAWAGDCESFACWPCISTSGDTSSR